MIWKSVLIAMQVAGIYGAINLTPEQKKTLHNSLPLICGQNGSGDKAAAAEAGVLQFVQCLGELFDYDNFMKEVTTAMTNGTLDMLIKGYCVKTPQVRKCILEVIDRVLPCLPPMFRVNKDVQINATDNLLQWVCSDKGDTRIALFMADKGRECVIKLMPSIKDCTRDLRSSIMKNLDSQVKCANYEDMSNCVLSSMLFCNSKVTAVLFNSIFQYIKDISPCKTYIKPKGQLKTLKKK